MRSAFVMRPHADDLDGLLFFEHFVHKTVLTVDPARAFSFGTSLAAVFVKTIAYIYHSISLSGTQSSKGVFLPSISFSFMPGTELR